MAFGQSFQAPKSQFPSPSFSECSTAPSVSALTSSPSTTTRKSYTPSPMEQPLLNGNLGAPKGLTSKQSLAVMVAFFLGVATSAFVVWGSSDLQTFRGKPKQPFLAKLKPDAQGQRILMSVQNRDVWVYVSAKARRIGNQALPAVVVLHGSEDTPLNIAHESGFEGVADAAQEPFLVIFPDMSTPGGDNWGFDQDLGFFRSVVNDVNKSFNIKLGEVYVCGHSAGGTMSLYLQNNLPEVFNGAAAVEAAIGHEWLWQKENIGRPTMVVWNRNDHILKAYNASIKRTVEVLRRHDAAASWPSFSVPVTVRNSSFVTQARQLWWGSVGEAAPPISVVFWETVEPTHHWPNTNTLPGSFDSSTLIWEFFKSTKISQSNSVSLLKKLP